MKLLEAALLLSVFFLLRILIKRLPAKLWVFLEVLLLVRLLLPTFPPTSANVWIRLEGVTLPLETPLLATRLFEQINPWIVGGILLSGVLSYGLLLMKKTYPGEEDGLYYHDGDNAYVMGFFKSRIFLPLEEDKDKRKLLLLHEQMHVRRGDPQILLFGFVVLAFHWYNPLVWLLFFRMRQDMDLACDEAVLMLGVDPKEYANLLLEKTSRLNPLVLSMRWLSIKERLKQMKRKKIPMGIALVIFGLLLVAILPFISGRNVIGGSDGKTEIWIDTEKEQTPLQPEDLQERRAQQERSKEAEKHEKLAYLNAVVDELKSEIHLLHEKNAFYEEDTSPEKEEDILVKSTVDKLPSTSSQEEKELQRLEKEMMEAVEKIEKIHSEEKIKS